MVCKLNKCNNANIRRFKVHLMQFPCRVFLCSNYASQIYNSTTMDLLEGENVLFSPWAPNIIEAYTPLVV